MKDAFFTTNWDLLKYDKTLQAIKSKAWFLHFKNKWLWWLSIPLKVRFALFPAIRSLSGSVPKSGGLWPARPCWWLRRRPCRACWTRASTSRFRPRLFDRPLFCWIDLPSVKLLDTLSSILADSWQPHPSVSTESLTQHGKIYPLPLPPPLRRKRLRSPPPSNIFSVLPLQGLFLRRPLSKFEWL